MSSSSDGGDDSSSSDNGDDSFADSFEFADGPSDGSFDEEDLSDNADDDVVLETRTAEQMRLHELASGSPLKTAGGSLVVARSVDEMFAFTQQCAYEMTESTGVSLREERARERGGEAGTPVKRGGRERVLRGVVSRGWAQHSECGEDLQLQTTMWSEFKPGWSGRARLDDGTRFSLFFSLVLDMTGKGSVPRVWCIF